MDYIKIKKFKDDFINEWRHVNDEVHEITSEISSLILNDMKNKPKYLGKKVTFPYYENKDGISYTFCIKNGDKKNILIKYTLYIVESEEDSENITRISGLNFNSSWDEESKTMIIVSTVVDKEPTKSFYETIEHEAEHMYEYAVGMQKKVDLYDKVHNMVTKGQNNLRAYYVASALYYTFNHEQDAFKQQFYIYLINLNRNISFDNALNEYKPFKQMDNAFDAVYDYYDDKETMKAINELGYRRRDYFKRLYFGYNRFIEKMKDVYSRWWDENKDRFLTSEQRIKKTIWLMSRRMELTEGSTFREKEKNLLEYKYEFFV